MAHHDQSHKYGSLARKLKRLRAHNHIHIERNLASTGVVRGAPARRGQVTPQLSATKTHRVNSDMTTIFSTTYPKTLFLRYSNVRTYEESLTVSARHTDGWKWHAFSSQRKVQCNQLEINNIGFQFRSTQLDKLERNPARKHLTPSIVAREHYTKLSAIKAPRVA